MHKQDIIDHIREDIQRYQRKIVALEHSIKAVQEMPLTRAPFLHDPEPSSGGSLPPAFAMPSPTQRTTNQAGVWSLAKPERPPQEPPQAPPPQAQETVQEAQAVQAIEAVPEDVLETDPRPALDAGKEPERKPSLRGKVSQEDLLEFVRKGDASGRTIADMTAEFGIGRSAMSARAHAMVQRGIFTMVRNGTSVRYVLVAEDKQVSLLSGAA